MLNKVDFSIEKEYDEALKELRKLNDDLFYQDFKETIENLKNHVELELSNYTVTSQEESELVIRRANGLLRELENQKRTIQNLLNQHIKESSEANTKFLENERKKLLFVYEELQKNINLIERDSKHQSKVISEAHIKHEKLIQEQYRQMKEQLASETQHIEEQLRKLQSEIVSSKEGIINSFAKQYNSLSEKQNKLYKEIKIEQHHFQEKNIEERKRQHDQLLELLNTSAVKSVNKQELVAFEKRQNQKQWFLLSVVLIEAALIGALVYI